MFALFVYLMDGLALWKKVDVLLNQFSEWSRGLSGT